ncbi:OmpA family protein [Aquincola tertiaricarbonis]|uniref:OmpA family protein n=1 Tax=Aquincola tertiaricarbonis TaxID=391953 RepID=A0ABY4SHI2_AQUTE|nr:OmpA family protein [Aquincola tertiaricarbonis]URI11367.1 OmpA family protein [Aquincola tertiaricarbonis]
MYQEDKDDTTRVGLWITFGVVALVVISVIASMVVRQIRINNAAPQDVKAVVEEVILIDGPLTGDLAGTLYFETAQATLPADAAAELSKVMEALAAAPARKVVLSGFHDATGDAARNAELAKQRALAARAALVAAGVDTARVQLRRPEVTTGSGSEQEARRVELRLVD